MLGSGLYFPHIDIEDPIWLRSAILFWDEIQTIAPSAIENPYQTSDTEICQKEGYLSPLRCDMHRELIDELGTKIISLADRDSDFSRAVRDIEDENPAGHSLRAAEHFSWDIEHAFDEVGMYPEKMSPEVLKLALTFGFARLHTGKIPPQMRRLFRELEMARIHPEKLSYILRDLFEREHRYADEDGEWLLVDGRFAGAYMAALAAILSKRLALSPLTSYEPSHGLSFRFMFDDMVDTSEHSAKAALVSVVMRGLRVDPAVPVERLIAFRRKRKDQYLEMSRQIEELSSELTNAGIEADADGGKAVFERASKIYEKKIDPQLRALKRELDHQSIQTVWDGAYRALTISVPSAGALAYFTGLTGPALLGAGAALAVADIGVRSYLAGSKARAANPFSYLHDINESFGLPDFS
jgi:hypothetical protein